MANFANLKLHGSLNSTIKFAIKSAASPSQLIQTLRASAGWVCIERPGIVQVTSGVGATEL
ncbi:hypothetical protein E2C01_031446 [Portunus trituberculatus]|uniref:Uncharacterized protein n=1 Tax=Portunus trituberculatus TaxID=210409 RepID=A0A5B7ESU0_PORTR|nr:hypothetical protein [Portunus trituberculatus]